MGKNTESSLGDNAFPKISGKPKDFLLQMRNLKVQGKLPSNIMLEGTVKLHGSHADIVFDLESEIGEVKFQSRNRLCAPTDSQQGWPRNVAKYPDELQKLKDMVLTRFQDRNPNTPLDTTKPLIIGGEWIGPKVQKDVGVSELSHRFVILTIQINGQWQNDTDYVGIEAPEASIFHVLRVPQYRVVFDTSDLTNTNPALFELQRLADEAEAECPFAASFGIIKSRGEGIVWKPGTLEGRSNAKYWLKTKGPIIGPENRIQLNSSEQDSGRTMTTAPDVEKLAMTWVTERRLEQAHEYLAEMSIDNQARAKEFRKWVIQDVLKEEATEIEELRRTMPGVEQVLRRKLGGLASKAYSERLAATAKK